MGNQTVAPPFAPLMRTIHTLIMPTSESKNAWPLIDGPTIPTPTPSPTPTPTPTADGSGRNGAVAGEGGDEGEERGVATSGGDADDDGSSVLSADDVACLSCAALYEASVDVPQTQAPQEMTGE